MNTDFKNFCIDFVDFTKKLYKSKNVLLHRPIFNELENSCLNQCLKNNYVSTSGKFLIKFENEIRKVTKSKFVILTNSGSSALFVSLKILGNTNKNEIITQPYSFVATTNSICRLGSDPVFVDIDKDTLSMSPESLKNFLENNCYQDEYGNTVNSRTKKIIKCCVPVHVFGNTAKIVEIKNICKKWNISIVEDSAEALSSYYKNKHLGTFGKIGILSFNGNKIITSGAGGAIITNSISLAKKANHLISNCKVPSKFDYIHDQIGYNYKMSNINASLGYAQIKKLNKFISIKRELFFKYCNFFKNTNIHIFFPPRNSLSNHWLNTIIFNNSRESKYFLNFTNDNGIQTRPLWKPLNTLSMMKNYYCHDLKNSFKLSKLIVNIPSSVPFM